MSEEKAEYNRLMAALYNQGKSDSEALVGLLRVMYCKIS